MQRRWLIALSIFVVICVGVNGLAGLARDAAASGGARSEALRLASSMPPTEPEIERAVTLTALAVAAAARAGTFVASRVAAAAAARAAATRAALAAAARADAAARAAAAAARADAANVTVAARGLVGSSRVALSVAGQVQRDAGLGAAIRQVVNAQRSSTDSSLLPSSLQDGVNPEIIFDR